MELQLDHTYVGNNLDTIRQFPDESIDMCVTSPPYYNLRDYGYVENQIGTEKSVEDYIKNLVAIFDEIKRALKPGGSCWVNIGDTHSGKSLLQVPSRFEIAMTGAGWLLRNEVIWSKVNPQPSSAKDRFNVSHEKFFFFTKNEKYWFEQPRTIQKESSLRRIFSKNNMEKRKDVTNIGNKSGYSISSENQDKTYERLRKKVVEEGYLPTTPMRTVWDIPTKSLRGYGHFAVFPEELVITPVTACCPPGGIVLDPFMGSGTTAIVAKVFGRHYIGTEIEQEYVDISKRRISDTLADKEHCDALRNYLTQDETAARALLKELIAKHLEKKEEKLSEFFG
jgi:DNA modification methylase